MGAHYSTPVDIWSMACMVFELATGDLLFDPRSGKHFDKTDGMYSLFFIFLNKKTLVDHLAQFIETLGPIPKTVVTRGKNARDFFNRQGKLKNISQLHNWSVLGLRPGFQYTNGWSVVYRFRPLEDVLKEKYHFPKEEADALGSFLRPMLDYDPQTRATARECLKVRYPAILICSLVHSPF